MMGTSDDGPGQKHDGTMNLQPYSVIIVIIITTTTRSAGMSPTVQECRNESHYLIPSTVR